MRRSRNYHTGGSLYQIEKVFQMLPQRFSEKGFASLSGRPVAADIVDTALDSTRVFLVLPGHRCHCFTLLGTGVPAFFVFPWGNFRHLDSR